MSTDEAQRKRRIVKLARALYRGSGEESLAKRLVEEGLGEEEASENVDEARRALEEDEDLASRIEWDEEVARVTRALRRREDEDDIVEVLIDDGWREDEANDLVDAALDEIERKRGQGRHRARGHGGRVERGLGRYESVPAGVGLLTVGWILAVLGGMVLGLIVPLILLLSKDPSTYSGLRYDDRSLRQGALMLRLAIAIMVLGIVSRIFALAVAAH